MNKAVERLTIIFFLLLLIISPIIAAYRSTDHYVCHYVSPGDTLSAIALKYLGNAQKYFSIAQLNGLVNPDLIIAGRYIRVEINPPTAIEPEPTPETAKEAKPTITYDP